MAKKKTSKKHTPSKPKRNLDLLLSEATKKVNVASLAAATAKEMSRDSNDVREVLETAFDLMREALVAGHPVSFKGVGVLNPYLRKATRNYHPSSGKVREVPARRHIKFRPSTKLINDMRDADG